MRRKDKSRGFSRVAIVGALSLCALLFGGRAQAQDVPAQLQAAIFFKVLSFDKQLPARSGKGVVLAIVTDGTTSRAKGGLVQAFKALEGKAIQGKAIRIVTIDFSDKGALAAAVQSQGVNVLYLAGGSGGAASGAVKAVAEGSKIPAIGGSEQLAEGGFAVGLTVEGGKPKLVINVKASQRQGMKLGADVLQLAKIIN